MRDEHGSRRHVTRREFLNQAVAAGAGLGAVSTLWSEHASQAQARRPHRRAVHDRLLHAAVGAVRLPRRSGCDCRGGVQVRRADDHEVQVGTRDLRLDTTPEEAAQIAEEIKKRNLKVASVYGGGIPVEKSLEAGIEGLRRLIDNCAACGTMNLLMGGIGDREALRAVLQGDRRVLRLRGRQGHGHQRQAARRAQRHRAAVPKDRRVRRAQELRHLVRPRQHLLLLRRQAQSRWTTPPASMGWSWACPSRTSSRPRTSMSRRGPGWSISRRSSPSSRPAASRSGALVVECLEPGDLPHTLAEAKKTREFLEKLTGQKSRSQGDCRKAPLQAGVAVADITPPVGYRMCGYFNERLSTGVLNPLHAKALVLRQGDTRAAMVFCDLIGLSPDVSEAGSRAGRAGDRHSRRATSCWPPRTATPGRCTSTR